jgi:hypothetical protein
MKEREVHGGVDQLGERDVREGSGLPRTTEAIMMDNDVFGEDVVVVERWVGELIWRQRQRAQTRC